jgi:hypothetical protein
MLGTEASIALRDQLLTELEDIGSAEEPQIGLIGF